MFNVGDLVLLSDQKTKGLVTKVEILVGHGHIYWVLWGGGTPQPLLHSQIAKAL
jgi:hypothetical protein